MATTIEMHAVELVARPREMSRVAAGFRNHRTLCTGVLYVIAIMVVLALVARY